MRELTPEQRALYDLAQAAAQGASGVDAFLDRICATIVQTFGFRRASVFHLDEESGLLTALAASGIPLDEVPRALLLSDVPHFAQAAESGEAVFVADVRAAGAARPELAEQYELRSALAIPLVSQGHCLGVLGADREAAFELEPGTLEVLTTIGAVSGVYLERALELSELRRAHDVARNFVALASHELRTPAAVVHGIAATLHLRGSQLAESQRDELGQTLYEQTDRLRRLVDQLLDLSRLEAQAIDIKPQAFPIRRRVEELLIMAAAERIDDVELALDPALEAFADPDAFDRIVSNLVTNAFRYGEPPVRVTAGQSHGTLTVRVEDSGPGVPAEFVPRLFERFAREETTSRSVTGSGLGLAIAQSYARAHGGELTYVPAEPKGARFELFLPDGPVQSVAAGTAPSV